MKKRTGVELIALERQRQIEVERFGPDRDARYKKGELRQAAITYLSAFRNRHIVSFGSRSVPVIWPWHDSWWKPTDDVHQLAKAGALIAAEIDRINGLEDEK